MSGERFNYVCLHCNRRCQCAFSYKGASGPGVETGDYPRATNRSLQRRELDTICACRLGAETGLTGGEMSFRPNWASHPGRTLSAVIENEGWTWAEAELALSIPELELFAICAGKAPITQGIARCLAAGGISTERFWMQRQLNYEETLARLTAERARSA